MKDLQVIVQEIVYEISTDFHIILSDEANVPYDSVLGVLPATTYDRNKIKITRQDGNPSYLSNSVRKTI